MGFVRVEQSSAHLAGPVRLTTVNGRDGPVARATFTAISNAWRGKGEGREEEATAIQWTLWGKAAENAAQYLSRGSHVNVTGRVQNNNYERSGAMVYGMTFTAEQVDYLDDRATSLALRERQVAHEGEDAGAAGAPAWPAAAQPKGPARGRRAGGASGGSPKAAARAARAGAAAAAEDDAIPF